jgi:hypothetical protein
MTRLLLRLVAALAIPVALSAQGNAGFPHAKHARLFPTCAGCHAGIATGDAARTFAPVALCATCHDGTVQPRVRWTPRTRAGAGLLVFSHVAHAAKAKDATCESCHAVADSGQWMNVGAPAPARCASCHAHDARPHLADDNTCATCHRPLANATALSDARVAALPRPASHTRTDYVSAHGAAARANPASCATCHARESCVRCHVDGARAPLIRALAADSRVARLVAGRAPVYPTPAGHRVADFGLLHATSARADGATCATCHARASCEACHTGSGAQDMLRRLPDAREATAPGVQLRRRNDTVQVTVRVHPAGFDRAHGATAASGQLTCASCHAQRFCSDCHTGERVTRRYHVANFSSTHAPAAYARDLDCGSCHSREAFCRDCHRQSGLAAKANIRSTVFHNAQPLWLLLHGGAARQDLTSCTTCHQQTYCLQCHSDVGARINPHGPGFDAARMASRNAQLCNVCHLKNPLGK